MNVVTKLVRLAGPGMTYIVNLLPPGLLRWRSYLVESRLVYEVMRCPPYRGSVIHFDYYAESRPSKLTLVTALVISCFKGYFIMMAGILGPLTCPVVSVFDYSHLSCSRLKINETENSCTKFAKQLFNNAS